MYKYKPWRHMTDEEKNEFRFSDPRGTYVNGRLITDEELGFPPDFDDPEDPPEPAPDTPRE